MFFNSRRKKISPVVKEYCASKENCRRLFMLKALGNTEQVSVSARTPQDSGRYKTVLATHMTTITNKKKQMKVVTITK